MAIKIGINNKEINWNDGTEVKANELMNRIGARKIREYTLKDGITLKELSLVDPFTIAIGVSTIAGAIMWRVYQVTHQQKETFKNNFNNPEVFGRD